MKKKITLLAVAILAVAAFGLTAFNDAGAAGPEAPTFQGVSAPQFSEGDNEPGPLAPYVDAAIAGILGMTPEEFQAARAEGARLDALIEAAGMTKEEFEAALAAALPDIVDQALADGVIDEAQAEEILANGLLHPRRGFGPLNPYLLEVTADFLGMSADDLQAALQGGTTMDDLLADAGKTHLELRMAIDAATPEIVAQALEDGAIGQDLADKIIEYGLPLGPCRHHPGGPGGPGGPGPNGQGAPGGDAPSSGDNG